MQGRSESQHVTETSAASRWLLTPEQLDAIRADPATLGVMRLHVDAGGLQCLQITTQGPGMNGSQPQFVNDILLDLFQGFSKTYPFQDLQDLVLSNQLLVSGHDLPCSRLALLPIGRYSG